MKSKSSQKLVYLAKVGILAAVAALLMLLEFPLPFAPSFYELDFSEISVLIAGFALGPVAGVLTELLKVLLNLVIGGTTTAFVGEAANFVTGVAFVLPASLIYKYRRSFGGALVGMAIGTVSLVIVGTLLNYFALIPAFSVIYGLPLETIIAMGTKLNASVTDLKTLVLFAVAPFNLVKGVACSTLTMLIYKRVSPLLKPHGKVES